jgi:hypothetical protein
LKQFLGWLNHQSGWVDVNAKALLFRQAEAQDPYELLDLLQTYLAGLDRTRRTKMMIHCAVRSFFMHNRCALPEDRAFKIHSTRQPTTPKLTLNHIQDVVKSAGLRDRSILLVKWQGLLDNTSTVYVGLHQGEQLVSQLRKQIHPVRLDLPKRKNNEQAWWTFIGKDATEALVEYFEKERGWPKTGEPIWLEKTWSGKVKPFSVTAFVPMWLRLVRRIGILPNRKGSKGAKHGYNLHEMRDIAKSLLHTHAKKDGFDMDCCEFWLGHTVDPLGYDKFYQDQEYVRKQYLIAEPYLNIVSNIATDTTQSKERIQILEESLSELATAVYRDDKDMLERFKQACKQRLESIR